MEAQNITEQKKTDSKTIYVQPNKTPFNNRFFHMPVEIMDGFVEMVRDMSLYKQYEQELQKLTLSGATLQDRADFEVNYIKRDIDRLGQCYFKNYMNYFEYFAALMNVINAWNLCRHNWQIQHPVPNEKEKVHENPQRDVEETTQSTENHSVKE
jgi:hypothetical protein